MPRSAAEHGLVRELGREHGIRLVQLDDQRVVVRGGKTGKCGLRIDVRILQLVIALDGGEAARGLLRVLHIGGETPGVGEGMGGYRLAVGELPAFLQLDCVLGGILVRGDTLATSRCCLPFASKLTRPSNRYRITLPPPISLVSLGIRPFCGSLLFTEISEVLSEPLVLRVRF